MKKILLFLMAFLLFAQPETKAETKTVTFIPNPATTSNAVSFKYWDFVASGEYNPDLAFTPTFEGNYAYNVGLVEAGEIMLRFDFTGKNVDASTPFNRFYPANWQLLGGFDFAVETKEKSKCIIKEVRLTHWNLYPYGYKNLTSEYESSYDNSTFIQTLKSEKGVKSFGIHLKDWSESVNATTGKQATSMAVQLAVLTNISVTYETIPPLDKAFLLNSSNILTGSYEYDNSATLRFGNGGKTFPSDTKIYYTIVPKGTTVTNFPVGDAADEAGIKSTPFSTDFTVDQSGDMYYWAYSASTENSSEPTQITLVRNNRVQIFAFLDADQGKLDGTVKIYNDKYPKGSPYKQPKDNTTSGTDWYKNIRKIVYVPNEPNNTDAIILEVLSGTLNINTNWVSSSDAKFVIRTLNGSQIKQEFFDCTKSPFSNAQCDFILSDDVPDAMAWEDKTKKKKKYKGGASTQHTFHMSQASGFADLSVVWEPGTANKIAAAPSFSVAPGSTAVQQGGVFRIIDKLELLINSTDGPVYYWIPTLEADKNYNTILPNLLNDSRKLYDGNTLTINKEQFNGATSGKIILQSALYSNEYSLGYAAQIYVDLFQPEHFTSLAEIIKPENTGKEMAVMADSPMTITGVYATRQNGGAQLSSYYTYVVDADGTAIKLVSTSPFPASYTAGAVIPAGGLVGEFRYNYGTPEIVVSNYTGFLKETTPGTAPEPAEVTTINTSTDNAIPDFNRKVVLRHAKWLRNTKSSMVEDADGNRYLIYSRLITPGVEASEFTEDMFTAEAGTLWAIEGYVGQVEGATAIFPTAKVLPCPETPTLLAPNPISGDVNAISEVVTVTVDAKEGYTYYYKTAENGELTVLPEGGLQLKAEDYTAAPCSLWVYASANGLYSVEPAQATITWHAVKSTVASIAEFKAEYLDKETDLPGSLTADKPGFSEDEKEKVVYHQFSPAAKAIIVEATPEWLYIRDLEHTDGATKFTSANYLMIHNLNEWHNPQVGEGEDARDLAPGDIITNFAIIPAHTSRGNLVSESTGFARTVQYVETKADFEPVFEPINVGYENPDNTGFHKNITLGENERMRLVQLKNVKIENPAEDVYTLVIGPDGTEPVSLAFDIFTQSVNGFRTAYNPDNADELYDIKGVLIRDNRIKDNETYAIALISFDTQHGAVAEPEVFVQGTTDAEAKAAEVQEFEHGLVVEIAPEEGSFVYYSLNGKDPLNNTDAESRVAYTDPIPVTLPEGQDRVVVKAFAYRPGYKPSATVTRTFVKTSRELSYLLNFINQGEQDRAYHFNGNVRIAAVADKWMMVRGSVGHYLPIYNADGWNTADYAVEGYLTDFLMTFDNTEGNIRGIAKDFKPSTDKPADIKEIDLTPDSVTFISEANARRYVKLHSAMVHSAASASDASSSSGWTVSGTAHESSAHRLAVEMLEFAPDKLRDGGMYDITGFVMLDKEGNAELWPLTATEIKQTERVEVKLNDVTLTPVSDASDASREYVAEFEKGALVTLFTSDTRESTKIYYSYDNEKWYTYGQPFLVLESADQIHAYAQAVGERASAHTHIKLTRKDVAAKVEFAIDNSIAGRAAVTLTCATEGAKIYWWTSSNTKPAEYAKTLVFNESEVIYAYAAADGKADSEVSHAFIKVAGSTGTPEIPADKISGKVTFSIDDTSDPTKVTVYLAPEEGLTGTIYYLINPTEQVTPENGLVYTNPIEMKEGGRIVAILVESGKYAGEPTDIAVWLIPTDITGIDSEDREDAIRAEGGNIIAPEGSEVYDITGRRVNATGLRAGIYIVRTPGGKAVKVKVD